MQIKSYQLSSHLESGQNRSIKGALFFGPNQGLVRQYADLYAQHMLQLSSPQELDDIKKDPLRFASCHAAELIAAPHWLGLESCYASLTGESRLIIIEEGSQAEKATAQAVKHALPQAHHPFIIKAGQLFPASSLRRLFEQDKTDLISVGCYEDKEQDLVAILQARAQKQGKQIDPNAMKQLVSGKRENRDDIVSLLDIILLYSLNKERIEEEDVREILSLHATEASTSMDRLAYAMMLGRFDLLEPFFKHGTTDAIYLIRLILSHLTRLLDARQMMTEGISPEQAVNALKPPIFFKYKAAFRQQLTMWDSPLLEQQIGQFLSLEEQLKSRPTAVGKILLNHGLLEGARQAQSLKRSHNASSY